MENQIEIKITINNLQGLDLSALFGLGQPQIFSKPNLVGSVPYVEKSAKELFENNEANREVSKCEAGEQTDAKKQIGGVKKTIVTSNETKPKTARKKATPKKQEAAEAVKKTETGDKGLSIEDLRTLFADKVKDHREELKAKLEEFSATSLSKLPDDKYDEFADFIKAL